MSTEATTSLKGRVNGYGCRNKACRHVMVTVDVDDGVTPFMVGCPRCGADAVSFMYPTQGCPSAEQATHEWYAPDEAERKGMTCAELEHAERGGLFLRRKGEKHRMIERRKPMLASCKVGRNEPCPCGSGQKFKRCHGGPERRAA